MPLAETVVRPLVTRVDPKAVDYAPVSLQEFQAMMLGTSGRGATVITLTALTVPEYRKTGFAYKDNIQKLARVNGFLNWVYEDSVNRQRVREGSEPTFDALPRAWGSHLNKTPFISHVTKEKVHKLYLKFKVQNTLSVLYLTLDGDVIPTEKVTPFLRGKPENTRQGVDKEVIERDYTVSNILAVAFNQMGYIIT